MVIALIVIAVIVVLLILWAYAVPAGLIDPAIREGYRKRGSDPDRLLERCIELDNAVIGDRSVSRRARPTSRRLRVRRSRYP